MEMRPLSEVCEIIMGQAPVGSSYNENGEGLPLVAGASDLGELTPKAQKFTTAPAKRSKTNDLILCIRATIGDLNWSDGEYCLGRGVAGLRPLEDKLDRNYLWHFVSARKQELAAKGTGSTFKQVSRKHISEWEIVLPPLSEQKRIATILDKANTLRLKRQQAIELADQFLRSVFLEMFGDPVSNSKGWDERSISEVSDVITGNTPPRNQIENYGHEIEWIKSDNINTPSHFLTAAVEGLSSVGLKRARVVDNGAILVTCIAGSPDCIGNAAIADRRVSFNQQINALVPSSAVTIEFLYSTILFGKRLIQNASTNGMKGMVSKSNLGNVLLPIPPLSDQEKYSKLFRDFVGKFRKIEKSYDHIKELNRALSHLAFTNQLANSNLNGS